MRKTENRRKCSLMGFPGGTVVKHPSAKAGDVDSHPGSERSPGGRNGNPFRYSHLENLMDRGARPVIVHRLAKSQTRLRN